MYFDFLYYRKVLAFVWQHKSWPGRNKVLLKLLLVTPLLTVFHTSCFLLDYVFFPALWRQQVIKPVFIVGHARSGTTLMHRLLAADGERFSYFYYWEMFFPALTQRALVRALGFLDRKLLRGIIEKYLQAWDEKTFGSYRHIHEQGLWIPEEDQFVMHAAFLSQQWTVEMPLMHEVDFFHIDELPARRKKRWMHHYQECVKRQLLHNGGAKVHLSKNPSMSGWVNALLETFPDARIVVMVRDPIQCIPSALKMMEGSWKARQWRPEQYAESLAAMTQISFESYRLPAQALVQRPATAHCFVDYRELIANPKQTVEQVYKALGLTLSEEYSSYLSKQQEREKKHTSKFKYKLQDFAVTANQIEHELAEFYQQYNWPRPSEAASAHTE